MTTIQYFVGLDLGSEKFSAAIGTTPWKLQDAGGVDTKKRARKLRFSFCPISAIIGARSKTLK